MKPKAILVILSMLLGSALHAEEASVEVAGVKYLLASTEVSKDGSVTNEYVPQGESINAWTTLLGVRHWPKVDKIGDAAGPWMKMVQPLLTQQAGAYKSADAKSEDDIIIEAWLSAPDRSYIEINLHRFVIEAGTDGVKAYQFAQKIVMTGGKGDPTTFIKNRDILFGELSKLELPLHTKKE